MKCTAANRDCIGGCLCCQDHIQKPRIRIYFRPIDEMIALHGSSAYWVTLHLVPAIVIWHPDRRVIVVERAAS